MHRALNILTERFNLELEDLEFLDPTPYALVTQIERNFLKVVKDKGIKKPKEVSWGDFTYFGRRLKKRAKIAIALIESCLEQKEAAKIVGLSESRLCILLTSSLARIYRAKLRRRFTCDQVRQIILKKDWDSLEFD